jgi:mRNA interferase HigB
VGPENRSSRSFDPAQEGAHRACPALAPTVGTAYVSSVRIIAKRTLRQFWEHHPRGAEARVPLQVWYSTVEGADWATPADVKATYGDASILKQGRVVFNIAGNRFRLVARINDPYRVVYIRFVGTHEEYDEINVETI